MSGREQDGGPSGRKQQDGQEDGADPQRQEETALGACLSGAPVSPSAQDSRSLPYIHEVAASSSNSRFPTGDLVRMSAGGGCGDGPFYHSRGVPEG